MVLIPLTGPFLSSLMMLSLGRENFRTRVESDRVLSVRISNVDSSTDIAKSLWYPKSVE